MLTPGHAVGHLGRKQTFERSQQCERESGRQHINMNEDENTGHRGAGHPSGSWPKWLPMVSTGRGDSHGASEVSATEINIPGQVGSRRRSRKIKAAEPAPIANAAGLMVGD